MLGIDLFCDEAFIRHCIRITNPNVEKGRVLALQKTTSVNVEPGIRCSLRTRCQHFSVYLLTYRLNLDVIASSSSIWASKSRNSLCLWLMKPLRLHTMVWSTSRTSLRVIRNRPYTVISRKVVGKNVHATIPKGNLGYDQYVVPNDCSCRTYFCCFPLALANITSQTSRAILSNFFEEQCRSNCSKYLLGLSRALFPTTFLEIAVY